MLNEICQTQKNIGWSHSYIESKENQIYKDKNTMVVARFGEVEEMGSISQRIQVNRYVG
jgi:hypothetical protein